MSSAFWRRSIAIWFLLCLFAGLILVVSIATSQTAGHGQVLLPLDDVYIHFQYARQIVLGQPFAYNTGGTPTSGATSFIYPWLLALGYLTGFTDLYLAIWALIVGAVALVVSAGLVYRIVLHVSPESHLIPVVTAACFVFNGAMAWHAMSGMETMLAVLFVLLCLLGVLEGRLFLFVTGATFLSLTRPEGGLLSLIAVILYWRMWQSPRFKVTRTLLTLIPLAVILVQPLVNAVVTGSMVASGNSAKSILGTVPFSWSQVLERIISQYFRASVELITGISPREGLYHLPFLVVIAAIGIFSFRHRKGVRAVGWTSLLWIGAGLAAVSTLDTAFWHFKRYQMPFIALLFPLAGWGLVAIRDIGGQTRSRRILFQLLVVAWIGTTLWTAGKFWGYYALNVSYVYAQPYQMAQWLAANTPSESVVAVHDVGMMRYAGERRTLDFVGLTTPGAADYWRNGPGSVAEFLIQERPDYVASYGEGHGYGLGLLAQTRLYGTPQAVFPVVLDSSANVALAADIQGIYRPEPSVYLEQPQIYSAAAQNYLGELRDSQLLGTVNVADLASEKAVEYSWSNVQPMDGFVTWVRDLETVGCMVTHCQAVDGGRRLNGSEHFAIRPTSDLTGLDVLLVTRVHPLSAGLLTIYSGGEGNPRAVRNLRLIPEIPGQWLEIVTLIPSEFVPDSGDLQITIESDIPDGPYEPYFHWIYSGLFQADRLTGQPVASYQNDAFRLVTDRIDYERNSQFLHVELIWEAVRQPQGDYVIFVHVMADPTLPPVAQQDQRPGGGVLPPQNWLPGVLHDTITVDLQSVPPGKYQIAVGLYDPRTGERLLPTGAVDEARVFIGEVEIRR
ncbi:MAG: hypothetical protein JNM70_10965 [Anaerolineae bacterium]|nr:hypothetical protein [Anaerolineae bacterium]